MVKDALLEKIEEYREIMISLSDYNDLNSKVVIESSMELDELINEYQKLS